MMKYKFWVLLTLGVLAVGFALLKDVWGGFIIFSISFLCLFCLYLAAVFIYQYLSDYKWGFEEDFAYYKAEMINSTAISEEEFENHRDAFIKKYKNSIARDKMIDIIKIVMSIMGAIICIVALCTGVFK